MDITIRKFQENYVIDVAGEVDMYHAHRLKDVVAMMMKKEVCIFILNLKKVTYVDSSGIGALLAINAMLAHEGMAFRIVNVARPVMRVMELTRLVGILPIEANELDAIESIVGIHHRSGRKTL
ncbi:MAG: STAS domain-containing protein [Spirochaetia bacterium]